MRVGYRPPTEAYSTVASPADGVVAPVRSQPVTSGYSALDGGLSSRIGPPTRGRDADEPPPRQADRDTQSAPPAFPYPAWRMRPWNL